MTEENKTAAIVDKVEDTLYPVVDKEKQLSKKQSQKRTAVKRISPKPASILANKSSYSNINSTITTISRDTVLSAATILLTYHAGIKANTENITLHLIPRKPGADTAKQNGELFNNGLVFTRLNDSTASYMVPNIQAFQQLKVSTSYNPSAINLIPTNAEEQNLNIEKGNNWQWAIKPKTDNADSVTITIAVIGKKAVGAAITIASSQFKVKADVNKTDPPDTNTGQWPGKYAGYLLSCVVAVIGLFVLIVRKKKKDTAGENANGPKT
jgi:hypothetical protein